MSQFDILLWIFATVVILTNLLLSMGCFQILLIMNDMVMNIVVHIYLDITILVFWGRMFKKGITNIFGSSNLIIFCLLWGETKWFSGFISNSVLSDNS